MFLTYLISSFFYRLKEFFRHWYIKSFYLYTHWVINFFERLDRFFAIKINFKNLFSPLYKDFSLWGYLLGFLFRSLRVIFAFLIYFFLALVFLFLYFLWLIFPVYVVFRIFFKKL